MAEIVPVVSEALEAQIRNLLPSQRGFGEDLQASNVITPIIDLTAAASGENVPVDFQRALAFGSQTGFQTSASTVTIANSPGFYKITAVICISSTSSLLTASIDITDGLTSKQLLGFRREPNGGGMMQNIEFEAFLTAGDTLSATSSDTAIQISGSVRQIGTTTGSIVNPSGFTPQ